MYIGGLSSNSRFLSWFYSEERKHSKRKPISDAKELAMLLGAKRKKQ